MTQVNNSTHIQCLLTFPCSCLLERPYLYNISYSRHPLSFPASITFSVNCFPHLPPQCGGGGLVAKSRLTLAIPWTARLLCPWRFSRQEYWSRLPFPSPGDLPDPAITTGSLALQADSLPIELWGKSHHINSPYNGSGAMVPFCEIFEYQKTLQT